MGYMATGILFGLIIASLSFGYFALKARWALGLLALLHLHPSAWRVLRRPSLAAKDYGGMGFGTIPTSLGFLTVIALTVAYLTLRPVSRTA